MVEGFEIRVSERKFEGFGIRVSGRKSAAKNLKFILGREKYPTPLVGSLFGLWALFGHVWWAGLEP